MRSNIVFCTMIFLLLAQAGCAPQAPQRYSLNTLIDGESPSSLVVTKAEACFDDSKRDALKFAAKADMGPQAVWREISLRLNIQIDDIAKITMDKPVEVGSGNNINAAIGVDVHTPPLDSPLSTVTGTITITALSENEISGSASLVFTDPENFNPTVEDSLVYEVTFIHMTVNHD
ncbi:MAG TPA: hypothetical protein VLA49_04290 [Anaerolineales bacterium]|nr:hypothetical protein [Anaerolineales bacterium]